MVLVSYLVTVMPHGNCNVPVSCKANGDKNWLGKWLNSNVRVESYEPYPHDYDQPAIMIS